MISAAGDCDVGENGRAAARRLPARGRALRRPRRGPGLIDTAPLRGVCPPEGGRYVGRVAGRA
jgi:hypothetical protein